MLYKEIISLCFEIRTEHTNTLCGQHVLLVNVKRVGLLHKVTTGIERVSSYSLE